jgi:hypothetical protein
MTDLQTHVEKVESARKRFNAAKKAHDDLLAKVRAENAAIFEAYETARAAKDEAETEARTAIVATVTADGKDALPTSFGVRQSVRFTYGDELRQWAAANMLALLVVDDKKAQAVLKTGLFPEAPAQEETVLTATISQSLGKKSEGGNE